MNTVPSAWRPRAEWPFSDDKIKVAEIEPYNQRWVEGRGNSKPHEAFQAIQTAKRWAYTRGAAQVLDWYKKYRLGDPFSPTPYQEGSKTMLKNGWLHMIVHYRAVEILCGREGE